MYTFPSKTLNNMTFTARRWGQFPTITYQAGGTAGSEIVTLASDLSNITIKVESTVSTNTQVKTAVEAALGSAVQSLYANDLVSIAITAGHEDDAVTAVAAQSMTGAANTGAKFEPGTPIPPIFAIDPITPAEGYVWYNATSHLLKYFDGTAIKTVATV